jgi:hypothetical protein
MATYLDYLMGLGETGATLGSGAMAGLLGMPYGVYKGATSGKLGTREANRIAEEEARKFMEQYTYQPRGNVAPEMLQTLGGLLESSKLPPVIPEAAMLASIPRQAVAAQAERAGMAAERAVAPVVERTMQRGGVGAGLLGDLSRGSVSPLDVYHGTPHTLPPTPRNPLGEFDASKIGTGEGAQSFGYGIYTAENPAVAKEYQFMERNWFDTSKAKYKGKSINSWYEQAQKDQERAFRTKDKSLEQDATARLAYWENIMTHNHPENVLRQFTDPEYGWDAATNYAKSIDLSKFKGVPTPGNLYKVDLPDEKIATMLDWDKPMAEQRNLIEKMRKALIGEGSPLSNVQQFELNDFLSDKVRMRNLSPQSIVDLNNPKIVKRLSEAGIPGVKYLDEGSRAAGKGTRNFVTFPGEEKNMTILERNNTGLLD